MYSAAGGVNSTRADLDTYQHTKNAYWFVLSDVSLVVSADGSNFVELSRSQVISDAAATRQANGVLVELGLPQAPLLDFSWHDKGC